MKIGASGAYDFMRGEGFFQRFAHVAFCERTQRFGTGTPIRSLRPLQKRHHLLQKVVFVPAAHFDSDRAASSLFQSIRRPF
jgi:hypothetical protein